MDTRLHCRHCGDVIGVYEPIVGLLDGRVVETSLAAHPRGLERAEELFHRDCFGERARRPATAA